MAKIEKNIYDWAATFEGLVIKSERDTFVCVFEQRHLVELEEGKFKILDTIKELELSDKIQITLSIAVSNEGESNYEKYKSAQAGLDIALGRGGDQAVVRREGKYTFFGGRSQEVEKLTKVKARIVSHALEELISEADKIMVMGHTNGDMDSMGASMGIYRLAKALEKEGLPTSSVSYKTFQEEAKNSLKELDAIFENVAQQKQPSTYEANNQFTIEGTLTGFYSKVSRMVDDYNQIIK